MLGEGRVRFALSSPSVAMQISLLEPQPTLGRTSFILLLPLFSWEIERGKWVVGGGGEAPLSQPGSTNTCSRYSRAIFMSTWPLRHLPALGAINRSSLHFSGGYSSSYLTPANVQESLPSDEYCSIRSCCNTLMRFQVCKFQVCKFQVFGWELAVSWYVSSDVLYIGICTCRSRCRCYTYLRRDEKTSFLTMHFECQNGEYVYDIFHIFTQFSI